MPKQGTDGKGSEEGEVKKHKPTTLTLKFDF